MTVKMKNFIRFVSVFLVCINILGVNCFSGEKTYAEGDLSVGDVEFYTSGGDEEILPDLNGAKGVSVKADISNSSSATKKVGLYLAYYGNNTLLSVTYDVLELSPTDEKTASVNISTEGAAPGRYVKAFVWDETETGHTPVIKEETLKATANIYVASNGDDSGNGTFTSPLKTVDAAKELVKTRNQDMTDDLFVYLREGTYYQDDSLTFTTSDSGTNGKNVVYTPYNGETVTISGGKKVSGFEIHDEEKNIWKTEINNI